jgi:hypothetical protein
MKDTIKNEWQQVLRAHVYEQKKQYASMVDLVLALAYVGGTEKARPLLEQSGYSVEQLRHLLLSLPSIAKLDLNKDYPPAKPDETLKKIIQTTLKPFIEGKEDVLAALKKMVPPQQSTRTWLQTLSMYFMLLWEAGHRFYENDNEGISKFVKNEKDCFEASFSEVRQKVAPYEVALDDVLWHKSPLGQIQTEYGEYSARLVAVCLLAEAHLVARGLVRVSELAWTYCPDGLLNWHRHLSFVGQEVEKLTEVGYLESNHEGVRIQSRLIVTEEFHDKFFSFIRDADPMGEVVYEPPF